MCGRKTPAQAHAARRTKPKDAPPVAWSSTGSTLTMESAFDVFARRLAIVVACSALSVGKPPTAGGRVELADVRKLTSARRYLARFHKEAPCRCSRTHRRGTAGRPSSNSEPHTASQSGAISNASPASSSTRMFSPDGQCCLSQMERLRHWMNGICKLSENRFVEVVGLTEFVDGGDKRQTRRSPERTGALAGA
jgi:hypothetical protein